MHTLIPVALALGLIATPAGGADVERTLPFVVDDYPRALAEARAQKLPLFIEAWAPW